MYTEECVNWSFNFDFHLEAFNTAGTIQSLVIRNLPWSADKSQTQLVRLDSWASHLFTSGNALLSQVGSSDEMTITLQMFTKFGIELNRYHTFDITPSMSVVATSGGDASISRWVMRGSGTFEVS